MKKINSRIIILISLILSVSSLYPQVTIGSGIAPEKAALLDIKEKADKTGGQTVDNGGLLLPRVYLEKHNELFPFLRKAIDPDPDYEAEKPAHTGLFVYNLTTDPNENFSPGIYQWNGQEWRKLAEEPAKAVFSIECSTVAARGTYIEGEELNSSHFLEIKATVTKAGTYSIIGKTDNGYYFSATGVFASGEGETFTIYAAGQGTPQVKGENIVSLIINGTAVDCSPPVTVNVLDNISSYTLNCSSAIVRGIYKAGTPLNASNYIEISVNVNSTGSYLITSQEVDGITFSGSGEFTTATSQTIRLYGSGTPKTINLKLITLVSNSAGGTGLSCPIEIKVAIPSKKILSLGSSGWAIHGSGGTADIFNSPHNFGTGDNSTFKTETPVIYPVSGFVNDQITVAKVQDYLTGPNRVDIVFMAFNSDLANTTQLRTLFLDFVRNGGVLIMLNEHNREQIGNFNFIKELFNNDNNIAGVDNRATGGGYVMKLPNVDDMILNGPFGDVRDKFIGEDSGYADTFTILPPEEIDWFIPFYSYSVNAGDQNGVMGGNEIFAFKAKNYNFFWCGDGGVGSSGNSTSRTEKPVLLSSSPDYAPLSKLYGRNQSFYVDNATFIANLLAWALYQAETTGINTR